MSWCLSWCFWCFGLQAPGQGPPPPSPSSLPTVADCSRHMLQPDAAANNKLSPLHHQASPSYSSTATSFVNVCPSRSCFNRSPPYNLPLHRPLFLFARPLLLFLCISSGSTPPPRCLLAGLVFACIAALATAPLPTPPHLPASTSCLSLASIASIRPSDPDDGDTRLPQPPPHLPKLIYLASPPCRYNPSNRHPYHRRHPQLTRNPAPSPT